LPQAQHKKSISAAIPNAKKQHIMSEWKTYKLSEIAEVFTGFPFKGEKYDMNNGIRVLRGENVSLGYLRWDSIKHWNEEFSEAEKYALNVGDIVIGMDGSRVGRNRAQIKEFDLPLFLAQRVARIRTKNGFNQDFISHIIKSDRFEEYVKLIHTGTSIPHISASQIKEFKISAPDLTTQTQIAQILTSLDDKIELNLQMNQTLEAMAQALFKEWFVNFNFPNFDGVMENGLPKGWRMGKVKEMYKTTSGGTPSRAKEEYYENGTINWVKSKELNGSFIFDTEEKITVEAVKNSSTKLIPKHSVLVAMYGATVGEYAITTRDTTCNQAICAVIEDGSYPFTYFFEYFKINKNNIIGQASGSAQQNISQALIQQLDILIPPTEVQHH
jgi:type I restriction enzyme, S subunit